jgi:small-conductance mechanosensitive channel
MIRLPILLLSLLLSVSAAAAPAPTPALTPDQARAALDVLNDPAKRAAVAATLQAILKAQPAAEAPSPAPPPAPAEASPPVAQPLSAITQIMERVGERAIAAVRTAQSLPLLWGWVVVMATNPLGQDLMIGVGWRLLVAMAVGAVVLWGLNRALRRPAERLRKAALAVAPTPVDPEDRAEAGDLEAPVGPDRWQLLRAFGQRASFALGRLSLTLLPLAGLLVTGHVLAGLLGDEHRERAIPIAIVLSAYALAAALIAAARIVLAPESKPLRLVPLDDEAAHYVMRWWKRLTETGVFGVAAADLGATLGLSDIAHDTIVYLVGLLLTLGVARIVVSRRRAVRAVLRAPEGATGTVASIRNGCAYAWHWLALAALAAIWTGWALDFGVSSGIAIRTVGLTILVLGVARLIMIGLLGTIDRLPAAVAQEDGSTNGLGTRLTAYHPALTVAVRMLVHGLTLLALLQVYGTGIVTWLVSAPAGQRAVSGAVTLGITIVASVAVWEIVNASIQRHLDHLLQDAQVARSARLRTLLPLLRTMLLIVIIVVAVLMILSELGVNIAPLLAGAGILGVAIGFGSQKLVQDLITGIFLLLENALQVGDQVNVAGLSGKVEGLSVRTIRLRALDGAVHIIPFSSVNSVTNHTRGVGNADVRVTVAYDADPDKVTATIAAIVLAMREEPDFAAKITSDFKPFGVDKIDAEGVTITGQVACSDSGRWSVQREINRRIKLRFKEAGIRFFAEPVTFAE